MEVQTFRSFDGKRYKWHKTFASRVDANKEADRLRGKGYLVRMIWSTGRTLLTIMYKRKKAGR